jgi:hypothetical protein
VRLDVTRAAESFRYFSEIVLSVVHDSDEGAPEHLQLHRLIRVPREESSIERLDHRL